MKILPLFSFHSLGSRVVPLFASFFFSVLIFVPSHSNAEQRILVDKLLTDLQRSIILVSQSTSDEDLPKLKKATLHIKCALHKEDSGRLSLFVAEFGTNFSKQSVIELSIDLRPPDASARLPVSEIPDLLSEAIIETAKAVKRAQKKKPELLFHGLSASVRFIVESDTQAGLGFSTLPITASFDKEVNSEVMQEIKLEFVQE